jgi:hypothetical protein
MVSEEGSAFSRGRIPAHEVRAAKETSSILLKAKSGTAQHRACLMQPNFATVIHLEATKCLMVVGEIGST